MDVGTWGEWAGAIGTTAAAVVALYLGGRDDERRSQRLVARRQIHWLADLRLRAFARWTLEVEEPDGPQVTQASTLDRECGGFYALVLSLGRFRKWRALRTLRAIYGARALEHVALVDDPTQIGWMTDPVATATNRPELLVDGDPGPLRHRGAMAVDTEDHRRLVAQFRVLLRL